MSFRRIFIPNTGQTNVSGGQYGLEEEASESNWGSSNLTISHLGAGGELHIQSGHQPAGHPRLRSTQDLSSARLSRGLPGCSAFSLVSALFVSPSKEETVDCLVCQDTFEAKACFHAPCGHYFCRECTAGMAEAAIAEGNEELFPLRCCNKLFSPKKFLKSLSKPLRASVAAKSKEISIPGHQRVYCPNETCSAFLGRSTGRKKVVSCSRCRAEVCSGCKQISHSPKPCRSDGLARHAREFASVRGWKVCPGCAVIVERKDGCPHMTCRCGTRFCYQCGRRQRWCRCRSL